MRKEREQIKREMNFPDEKQLLILISKNLNGQSCKKSHLQTSDCVSQK